ncbi:MAG: SDR family NAD(P)-dependent oxidoreductase, partial [Myxococcota bacterium]
MEISNRKVLITGGSAGIGRQLAIDLTERGAAVLVCGRSPERLDTLRAEHPNIGTFVCDVRDYESVVRLREFATQSIGVPEVLFNNAAIFRRFDINATEHSIDLWLDEVDINLMGTLRVTHAFLPLMKNLPEATILNLTSPSAYIPLASAPVYSATKASLHSWTQSLRHQLRGSPVRVLELNPPAVDTQMNQNNPDVEGLKLWSVEAFSRHVITELERSGSKDILVGDAKLVRRMSRVA